MESRRYDLADGVVTGLVLAGLLTLPCVLQGRPLNACGEILFLSGAGLAVASLPFAWVQSRSPTGILGLIARWHRGDPTPTDPERPRNWLDRVVSPHNVWLIAGGVLVTLSFTPPFLAAGA